MKNNWLEKRLHLAKTFGVEKKRIMVSDSNLKEVLRAYGSVE